MKEQLKVSFLFLLYVCFFLLAGCGAKPVEKEQARLGSSAEETFEDPINISDEHKEEGIEEESSQSVSSIKKFGQYLEALVTEGKKEELSATVISRRLTYEEAAQYADASLLLKHWEGYQHGISSARGAIIIEADVNQDGIKDLIEFVPRIGEGISGRIGIKQNSLTIYLGETNNTYRLAYSQPFFEYDLIWLGDHMEAILYGGDVYLIFRAWNWEKWRDVFTVRNVVKGYLLKEGVPCARMHMEYTYTGIEYQVLEKKREVDIKKIEENINRICYDNVGYEFVYSVDFDTPSPFVGSGESKGTAERKDDLQEKMWDIENESMAYYREEYDNKQLGLLMHAANESYYSDINNDGTREEYVKQNRPLLLYDYFVDFGLRIPFMTGELYGRHEGRDGLLYYMEVDGKPTDLESVCGLDIWKGELTPQMFWVEQEEAGNITYIVFQDGENEEYRIEGYLIEDDSYERVVEIQGFAKGTVQIEYEEKDAGREELLDYMICQDGEAYMALRWGRDNPVEDSINENIRAAIDDFTAAYDWMGKKWVVNRYVIVNATKAACIAQIAMIYEYDNSADRRRYGEDLYLEVNLITGECEWIEESELPEYEGDTW